MKRRPRPMTPPDRGDIVWVEFAPSFGHEQAGRRPALVISNLAYNQKSSLVIVCPVTSSGKAWPFNVRLARDGTIQGSVIVDQIKAIDKRRICSGVVDKLSLKNLALVQDALIALFMPNGAALLPDEAPLAP